METCFRSGIKLYLLNKGIARCHAISNFNSLLENGFKVQSRKLHINCSSLYSERHSQDNTSVPPKETVMKPIESKVLKIVPKKAIKKLDRKYITSSRAMSEYLIKPENLEGLRKAKRRSPYFNEPSITVYSRKDVEEIAIQIWGNKESLEKEKKRRKDRELLMKNDVFDVKRILKEYRNRENIDLHAKTEELKRGSGKVVLTAVGINAINCVMKSIAWFYSGSHSMFSETVHSFADTCNQLILAFGLWQSRKRATKFHPYGYSHMRNVASLVSGVGIFCVGAGLSVYHGLEGIFQPSTMESLYLAFIILAGSLVSESITLILATVTLLKGCKVKGVSLKEYLLIGEDPTVSVVFMEDVASVIGLTIAASCMSLAMYLNNSLPDAIGSLLLGGLLASISSVIIYTNSNILMHKSVSAETLQRINDDLEQDDIIRAIYDVKGIDMGNSMVRYKAEVDIDGRELTRLYLDNQDLEVLLKEVQEMKTIEAIESFILKHGENIVDLLGAEIDRIEKKLKVNHPEIRHCDLEVL